MNELDFGFDPVATALKQMHRAVVEEELPHDILRLLDEFDAKIVPTEAIQ